MTGRTFSIAWSLVVTLFFLCARTATMSQGTYTIVGNDSRIVVNDRLVLSSFDSSITYDYQPIARWVAALTGPDRTDSVFAIWSAFPALEFIADPNSMLGSPVPPRAAGGLAGLNAFANQMKRTQLKQLAYDEVAKHIEVVLDTLREIVGTETESLSLRDNAASALSAILNQRFSLTDRERNRRLLQTQARARDVLKAQNDLSERRRLADGIRDAEFRAETRRWDDERRATTLARLRATVTTAPPLSKYQSRDVTSNVRIFYLEDSEVMALAAPLLVPVLVEELTQDPNLLFAGDRTKDAIKLSRELRADDRRRAAEDLGKIGAFAATALPDLRTAARTDPNRGVRRASSKAIDRIEKAAQKQQAPPKRP